MRPLYEIFDEFEMSSNKKERMDVIGRNLSQLLVDVLKLTYHPHFQWKVKNLPEDYKVPNDVLPGITHDTLNRQLRRLYMFQVGHPTAEKLTEGRRKELLIQMLESLEPREAEIILGIFNKDLGVKGLDYKFVKEAFPKMLP
jgi:hypothetical protein